MIELLAIIKSIDKDHNGYVTRTEMDDILKVLYKDKLSNTNLKHLMRPFCSSANKVLLDYKAFTDYLIRGIENKLSVTETIHQ